MIFHAQKDGTYTSQTGDWLLVPEELGLVGTRWNVLHAGVRVHCDVGFRALERAQKWVREQGETTETHFSDGAGVTER